MFSMIWYVLILIVIVAFLFFKKNNLESFNNYKYTAVIIEPREHPALEFVLQNFNDNLSNDWGFVIFHGNKNIEYTQKICDKVFTSGRFKMINLNIDNLNIDEYSQLFYKSTLYDNIPTETFLIFQTDSIICSKHKDLINNFLDYDYVGAPWWDGGVGNGGLSLRKKSKMLEVLENCKDNLFIEDANRFEYEDRVFSNGSEYCKPFIDMNIPSIESAKDFSIETMYNSKSFGIHKAYHFLKNPEKNELEQWCPEMIELEKLNN